MKQKNKKENPRFAETGAVSLFIFLLTILSVTAVGLLHGAAVSMLVRNGVFLGIGCFGLLFEMADAVRVHEEHYENEDHKWRFFLCYTLGILLAAACSFLPITGWPYLSVFVTLTLFSCPRIGICAGTVLLTFSCLLSGAGIESFLLYFVSGFVGSILFGGLDETYKTGLPTTLSLAFLFVGECADVVLSANETLRPELFLMPLINLISNAVLMLIVLAAFSNLVIFRYRGKYLEINDTEFPLLVQLKEYSKTEYLRTVHSVHFCERIAVRLRLPVDRLKTLAYYHRIGVLNGGTDWEHTEALLLPHAFPKESMLLLKESLSGGAPVSKESCVLLFSDEVIASLLALFEKDASKSVDYISFIERLFKQRLETGILSDSEISLGELETMKKIFLEDTLYYDFLR